MHLRCPRSVTARGHFRVLRKDSFTGSSRRYPEMLRCNAVFKQTLAGEIREVIPLLRSAPPI